MKSGKQYINFNRQKSLRKTKQILELQNTINKMKIKISRDHQQKTGSSRRKNL